MDTAFFILSKLIGLALQVETWLVIGMVVTLAAGRFELLPENRTVT